MLQSLLSDDSGPGVTGGGMGLGGIARMDPSGVHALQQLPETRYSSHVSQGFAQNPAEHLGEYLDIT
ncbi:hypothetical protein R1flu_010911 [Riccia fluitans]|uniref:Uncharacterized protein n=1 Tax=Riccia fluitans TaxID=41844 RepID=A0ABD1Z8T0_9MARC